MPDPRRGAIQQHLASIEDRRAGYGLTQQEMAFVLDYLVDFDAERAYSSYYLMDDGEDPYTSSKRLLAQPLVQGAIAAEIAEQGRLLFLSKEAIVARTWQEAINPRAKPGERLKALELTAKLVGVLSDKKDDTPQPGLNITISDPKNIVVERKNKQSREIQTIGFQDDCIEISDIKTYDNGEAT